MDGAAPDRRADLVGALWMVAAMAAFAVEDAFIKTAGAELPAGQILVFFGLGGALVFAGLARAGGRRLLHPDVLSRPMRARFGFEIAGRLFYTLAITLIPLSTATVILQATPVVVVAGAALIFGEAVGWRRWGAVALGLAGVLVIVRPGTGDFSALSILAVLGMIGFAGRDLASRAAPRSLAVPVLGFWGFVAVLAAGALVWAWEGAPPVRPGGAAAACLMGAALIGAFAYPALMRAMRTGDVSAVTPFRYLRLPFGAGLGIALFGESPGWPMLVGSALIVLSGLIIIRRGGTRAAARQGGRA